MTMKRGRLFAGATALVLASAVGVVVVTKPDVGRSPGGTAAAAEAPPKPAR